MHRIGRPAIALLAVALSSCTRIDVKSTTAAGVPASLHGEWAGTWTSTGAGGGAGNVALQVRSFDDHPVVAVAIDNPCVRPANWTFSFRANRVQLLADGVPVFVADVAGDRRSMTGTYACHDDQGTWTIHWDRALPPIGDVTGSWFGSLAAAELPGNAAFALELQQTWTAGRLGVAGEVEVAVAGGTTLRASIARGSVEWNGETFDLLLETDAADGPIVRLAGVGDAQALTVTDGVFSVAPDPRLPFRTGFWQAAWLGR